MRCNGQGPIMVYRPPTDPALQVCHITSQQHYHLFPVSGSSTDGDDNGDYSLERLCDSWNSTWFVSNGILLLSHLHELFGGRWFSIHPETQRIRVFVPYGIIEEYHGRKANLSSLVSRAALWHHYEMCCIENMGAGVPLPQPNLQQMTESGRTTPRTPYSVDSCSIASTPSLPFRQPRDPTNDSQARGDPSKRQHTAPAQENIDIEDGEGQEPDGHRRKRRRLSDPVPVHSLSSFSEGDAQSSFDPPPDRFTEEL